MSYLFQGGAFASAKQTITEPFDVSTSGTVALDLANGPYQRIKPTTSTSAVTVSDTIASLTDGTTLRLEVVQPSTGSCTVAWGTGVVWPYATAPTLTTTAGEVDVIDCVVVTMSSVKYLACKHVSAYAPPVPDTSITNADAAELSGSQRFEASASTVFDFDGSSAFSVSLWINPDDATPASLEFIFSKISPASSYSGFELYNDGSYLNLNFLSNFATSNFLKLRTNNMPLVTGKWSHVVCVFISKTSAKIYVDGADQTLTTISSALTGSISSSSKFELGARSVVSGSSYQLNGKLDEVSVWSKALSASEVSDLFHAGSPVLAGSLTAMSGLDAWYRMGDDSSDDFTASTGQITDQTSNSYNLTPVGTTSSNEVQDVPERRDHWYKMNTGVSSAVTDEGKLANLDLTIYGGPTNVTLGNNGGTEDCVSFDGVNDGAYCDAGSTNVANLMTYSFWLKLNATPGNYDHFFSSSKNSFGGTGGGVGLYYISSKLRFWTNNYNQYSSVDVPTTGTWNHIACCLDITNNIKKVYLNGSAGTDYSGTNVSPVYTFASGHRFALAFFASGTTGVSYFGDCQISDFRIYDRLLSSDDVSHVYNSGTGDWP